MADDLAKIKARLHGGLTKLPNDDRPSVISQAKTKAAEAADALLKAHAKQEALQKLAFEPNSVTKVRDPQALSEMASDMLAGPLGFMPAGIIKQKGGQWLDRYLDRDLKRYKYGNANVEQHLNHPNAEEIANMEPHMQDVWRNINNEKLHNESINKWIDSNLRNYIKNQMGTKEDPVRALAEQGVSHIPLNEHKNVAQFEPWTGLGKYLWGKRARAGVPSKPVSESDLAKQWENITDYAIHSNSTQDLLSKGEGTWSPWLGKIEDRSTPVHQLQGGLGDLGFDHIIDVLKQDLASGAIRPEQLSKVSISDAVRRAHLFDQEMAKKMQNAALQQQKELPIHKDYGESGYKWHELKHPTNPEITEQALKYEGDTMGHCVGGYCPDVLQGRTKIYSLRDAKGEPHVTIEVRPDSNYPQIAAKMKLNGASDEEVAAFMNNPPHDIIQIKGKQNQKPKDEYIPYVQDFVKSQNWGHVSDIKNANMERIEYMFYPNQIEELKSKGFDVPKYITQDELDNYLIHLVKPE